MANDRPQVRTRGCWGRCTPSCQHSIIPVFHRSIIASLPQQAEDRVPHRAKQTQFPESQTVAKWFPRKGLRQEAAIGPPGKQSQFAGAGGLNRRARNVSNRPGTEDSAPGRGPGPCRAKQSQFPGSRICDNDLSEKRLCEILWLARPKKTKPICRAHRARRRPSGTRELHFAGGCESMLRAPGSEPVPSDTCRRFELSVREFHPCTTDH